MAVSQGIERQDEVLAELSAPMRALASRGHLKSYRKHTIVLREGELGDTLFIVLRGMVRLFAAQGKVREITYATAGPGECFGESALDGGPRCSSVVTVEPTVCCEVPRTTVRERVAADPGLAMALLQQVVRRARQVTATARSIALLDVYGRVRSFLEAQHGPARTDGPVILAPLTHQAIASRVASSREMVSRLLKELEKGGYVELGVKRIVLLRRLPPRW